MLGRITITIIIITIIIKADQKHESKGTNKIRKNILTF